jgi:hypothetical protein
MSLTSLLYLGFSTYTDALRDEVMRNPGGRYTRVRPADIEALFRPPKPRPEPEPEPVVTSAPQRYRHLEAYLESYNDLASTATELPDAFRAVMFEPGKGSKSLVSRQQGVTLTPVARFTRPGAFDNRSQIVELNCIGAWPGDTRVSELRLTLFPYYRPLTAIVRRGQYSEAEQV